MSRGRQRAPIAGPFACGTLDSVAFKGIHVDASTASPSRPVRASTKYGPLIFLYFVGMGAIASGLVAIELAPLRRLGIDYPRWLNHYAILVPAACLVAWLLMRRTWPRLSWILTLLACTLLINAFPWLVERYVTKLTISRRLEFAPMQEIEHRLGFKLFVRSAGEQSFIYVAPQHTLATMDELRRVGILDEKTIPHPGSENPPTTQSAHP